MSDQVIDLEIMDDIEEEEIRIIYKGKKEKNNNKEEEIIELKTNKNEFLKKFRYFKRRNKEIEQEEEIFIHDSFYTSTFKAAIESLNRKTVEVGENNYEELLLISDKYEYIELSRTIHKFIEERPDLERILSKFKIGSNKEKQSNTEEEEDEEEYRDYGEEPENKEEEMIASHLDFFLERGLLKRMKIHRLLRILNSKSRVVHNHHALFEFIKEIIKERNQNHNQKFKNQDKDKEYFDMLFGTLDYSEMTISEIEYVINSEYYSNVFQPKHSEIAMKTIIESMNKSESKIEELEDKIKTLSNKLEEHILNSEQEESQRIHQIETIEEKINKESINMKNIIDDISRKIENNKETNQNLLNKQEHEISQIKEKQLVGFSNINQVIEGIRNKINEIEVNEEINRNNQSKRDEEISQIKEKQLIDISNINQVIEGIRNKINEIEEINKKENKSQQKDISEIRNIIFRLEEQKSAKEITMNASGKFHPFTSEINSHTDGILCCLKKNEKSPFKHLFIASQSSGDIYNLIDPNTKDDFQIYGIGGFIEIELQEPVDITGIKIFSSDSYFPKTLDIEINDKLIQNIKETKELNGQNQSMTIDVKYNKTRKIRITNQGKNWNNGDNSINIKRIELLSNDARYLRGVFSTLVYENEDHDPHKCPVIMSSSNFDFNKFHLIDSQKNISTYSSEHSWFQIEFTEGRAVLFGFRLKKCKARKLKSYKIICTDDKNKPEELWTTLIEMDERREDEHKQLDIYEFSQPSPPTKYVRLIQTGSNWSNTLNLKFYHFDLFGNYLIT